MSEYVPVANIYRCIQCLSWHCQSILILWHFDCSLDFFNFSLRGTKIRPKKPAFLRPIKSFIFLKYMPRLHLLPSRISKFSGGEPPDPPSTMRGETPLSNSPPAHMPVACPVSAFFQKFSIYLKTFWEPWTRCLCSKKLWSDICESQWNTVSPLWLLVTQLYI